MKTRTYTRDRTPAACGSNAINTDPGRQRDRLPDMVAGPFSCQAGEFSLIGSFHKPIRKLETGTFFLCFFGVGSPFFKKARVLKAGRGVLDPVPVAILPKVIKCFRLLSYCLPSWPACLSRFQRLDGADVGQLAGVSLSVCLAPLDPAGRSVSVFSRSSSWPALRCACVLPAHLPCVLSANSSRFALCSHAHGLHASIKKDAQSGRRMR